MFTFEVLKELKSRLVKPEQPSNIVFKYTTFDGDEFGFSENQQNNYQIKVTFPEQYNSAEYEGIIEIVSAFDCSLK